MFKRITIELTGPVCNCQEQNLAWGISLDEVNRPQISIQCEICKTKLIVSNAKFVAVFTLDQPYPAKKAGVEPKAKPEPTDGCVVIPFPKKDG